MITIANYNFEGPYMTTAYFESRSGVYAVLDARVDGLYYILDVGESHDPKNRLANHDRSWQWSLNASGQIHYAVHYTPHLQQSGRMEIEQEIRRQYNPPCGQR